MKKYGCTMLWVHHGVIRFTMERFVDTMERLEHDGRVHDKEMWVNDGEVWVQNGVGQRGKKPARSKQNSINKFVLSMPEI